MQKKDKDGEVEMLENILNNETIQEILTLCKDNWMAAAGIGVGALVLLAVVGATIHAHRDDKEVLAELEALDKMSDAEVRAMGMPKPEVFVEAEKQQKEDGSMEFSWQDRIKPKKVIIDTPAEEIVELNTETEAELPVAPFVPLVEKVIEAEPAETEAPVEMETPVETEAPMEMEAPVETEKPVEPVEVEAPVETQAPIETEAPVTHVDAVDVLQQLPLKEMADKRLDTMEIHIEKAKVILHYSEGVEKEVAVENTEVQATDGQVKDRTLSDALQAIAAQRTSSDGDMPPVRLEEIVEEPAPETPMNPLDEQRRLKKIEELEEKLRSAEAEPVPEAEPIPEAEPVREAEPAPVVMTGVPKFGAENQNISRSGRRFTEEELEQIIRD